MTTCHGQELCPRNLRTRKLSQWKAAWWHTLVVPAFGRQVHIETPPPENQDQDVAPLVRCLASVFEILTKKHVGSGGKLWRKEGGRRWHQWLSSFTYINSQEEQITITSLQQHKLPDTKEISRSQGIDFPFPLRNHSDYNTPTVGEMPSVAHSFWGINNLETTSTGEFYQISNQLDTISSKKDLK